MTKLVVISRNEDLSGVAPAIGKIAPDLQFLAPDGPEAHDAEVAICWNPPPGALAGLPRLKLVHAVAAGIDNILSDPAYPATIPLCRIVDPEQAKGMSEFVLWGVLYFHRGFDQALSNQHKKVWATPRQVTAKSRTVGIMGLGGMGLPVANDLLRAGFRVRGWSREVKRLDGITCFAGRDALPAFLSGTDILVCLLPLTSETRGLMDAEFLRHLPKDAKLIHVGRGEQLVIEDLIGALNNNTLGGAIVDVFDAEPLESHHPAWHTPNLVVTPHMASFSTIDVLAEQIVANIRRLERGEALCNQVDLKRGF